MRIVLNLNPSLGDVNIFIWLFGLSNHCGLSGPVKPGFHINAMSRRESQGVARSCNYCDLKKWFPYDRNGSQRIPTNFTFIKFQTKIFYLCDCLRQRSQGVARSRKQSFSRFPNDRRESKANLITFIATRCDSLRLLAIIWKPGLRNDLLRGFVRSQKNYD